MQGIRWGCAAALAVQWAAVVAGSAGAAQPEGADPRPYIRVKEENGGDTVVLEVASRRFEPDAPTKPVVHLAGAVHIADRAFYDALQEFLDAQPVVLFEGVKPPGAGAEAHDGVMDDADRIKTTERRLRFLAIATEKYRAEHDDYPRTLAELESGLEARIASLVRGSFEDAWGHAITYVPAPVVEAPEAREDAPVAPARRRGKIDFVSLGADGQEGGEGVAKDLRFSDQKSLTREERAGGEGLQKTMADAFGLVFQLEAMNENGANWRNSDLSIDQVQRRLDEAGANGGMLFSVLEGSSFFGRLAGTLLRMIGSVPEGRAMFKVMLAEMLSRADAILGNLPGEMGGLMKVIIEDRNAVVVDDLARIIETEPEVKTVAIIYGAGHLPDLERRLATLGYTPAEDTWRPAIRVSSESEKLPKGSVRQMRPMLKRMVEMQLRQVEAMQRRAAEREKKRATGPAEEPAR